MKIKRGMSLALGLGVLVAGAGGALFGVPAHAASCVAAEALATEGIITSEAELQYAIANEVASVKLGNDFTITCNPSYFTDNFTLDLNGHTLTSEVSWALDIETSGKTLTIQDTVGGGKYTFNDAGIWAQDGANVTLTSGVVEATAGRGRAVQVTSGKLTAKSITLFALLVKHR